MRKILSFVAAALLMITTGCNNSKKADKQADELIFQCERFDTVAYYKGDSGPKCTISISLHHAQGPNAHVINDSILKSGIFLDEELRRGERKTIPKAIKIVVKNHIKGFKSDVKEVLGGGDGDIEAMSDCYYNVKSSYAYGRDGIINYRASYDAYLGGAHGSANTFYLNFDPESGKMYKPKDIVAEGADDKLAETIALRIARQHNCQSVDDLKDREGIFDIFDPYVPDNFVLGKDSITFVYQCEEIGPYAVGEITTKFAYKELEGLLK